MDFGLYPNSKIKMKPKSMIPVMGIIAKNK
jgi:hypothetical protein